MRFRSVITNAIAAPMSAVTRPMEATANCALPTASNSGKSRATRNTPAVTIVAAWMSALTGVGPSIASGSHTCSGNCADLPIAPKKTRNALAVTTAWFTPGSPSRAMMSRMPTVSNSTMSSTTPMSRPTSPILVVTNAFSFAASEPATIAPSAARTRSR